jgi:hypothetical protein
MEINIHLFTSIALAVVLYPFFGWISVFVIAGGYLVDFDHYVLYVIRTRDWNLGRAINYYRKRRFLIKRPVLHIFHTIEAFIVLAALSLYWTFFLVVLFGYLLHMLLDLIDAARCKKWDDRVNSILYWIYLVARKKTRKSNLS